MTAPMLDVLAARARDLGAETWRVRREQSELVVWQDRADDRRQVVACLLFWRWMVETGRVVP